MNLRQKISLAAAAAMSTTPALGAAATADAATAPPPTSASTAAARPSGPPPAPTSHLKTPGTPNTTETKKSPDTFAAAWVYVGDSRRGRAWQTWYPDTNNGGYLGHYGATTDTDAGVTVQRFIYYHNRTVTGWTSLPPGATYYYSGADSVWFRACDNSGCGDPIEL